MNNWTRKNIDYFIENLKDYYTDCRSTSFPYKHGINDLSNEGKTYLNDKLDLKKIVRTNNACILLKTLKIPSKDNFSFFLLRDRTIDLDVSKLDKTGKSVFILLATSYLNSEKRVNLNHFIDLFNRDYKIKKEDVEFILNFYKKEEMKSNDLFIKWSYLRFATKLSDSKDFEIIYYKSREVFTILSFKLKRPVYHNFKNLLEVGNNAMQYYRIHGDIIFKAINVFNVRDEILKYDRKGTFKRKYEDFLKNKPIQDKKFESLIKELFEELED